MTGRPEPPVFRTSTLAECSASCPAPASAQRGVLGLAQLPCAKARLRASAPRTNPRCRPPRPPAPRAALTRRAKATTGSWPATTRAPASARAEAWAREECRARCGPPACPWTGSPQCWARRAAQVPAGPVERREAPAVCRSRRHPPTSHPSRHHRPRRPPMSRRGARCEDTSSQGEVGQGEGGDTHDVGARLKRGPESFARRVAVCPLIRMRRKPATATRSPSVVMTVVMPGRPSPRTPVSRWAYVLPSMLLSPRRPSRSLRQGARSP